MSPEILLQEMLPGFDDSPKAENRFLDNFAHVAGSPDGVQKLRELILQLAVQGKLVPQEKKRNTRHVIVHFQEFIDEFEEFEHIALVQSASSNGSEARIIRDHVNENFPGTPFTEHTISLPIASLFGPAAYALIIIEKNDC